MTTFIESLSYGVKATNDFVWGWPLIIFFIAIGLIATFALDFVQFRYFFKAWRLVLAPQEQVKAESADMNPFQAFVNALSTVSVMVVWRVWQLQYTKVALGLLFGSLC